MELLNAKDPQTNTSPNTEDDTYEAAKERGKALVGTNRYKDACIQFERALFLAETPRQENYIRAKLAGACFHIGAITEMIHWAKEAIRHGATEPTLGAMHTMAALGLKNLGNLDDSAKYYKRAHELAIKSGNMERASEILANLASIHANRGKFSHALEICALARTSVPESNRLISITESYILRLLGRFEEAKVVLFSSQNITKLSSPALQLRRDCLFAVSVASLATDAGDPIEARTYFGKATPAFVNDEQMAFSLNSLNAGILALENKRADSETLMVQVEQDTVNRVASRTTLLSVFSRLAEAALAIERFDIALRYAQRYLEMGPFPSYRTVAYYLIGESHMGLGNHESAKESFQQSVEMKITTYYADKARIRLEQL